MGYVFCTGFMLWFAGAQRIEGAQASALTAVVPVSAAGLAAVVLHESIGAAQWWAMACVLGAVALIARDGARARVAPLDDEQGADVVTDDIGGPVEPVAISPYSHQKSAEPPVLLLRASCRTAPESIQLAVPHVHRPESARRPSTRPMRPWLCP